MRISPYSRVLGLAEPTEQGLTHAVYNTVVGSITALSEEAAAILQRGLDGPISDDDIATLGQQTVADLVRQGWLLVDGTWEPHRIEMVAQRIRDALSQVAEYALMPWPHEGARVEPEHAVDALSALAEVEDRPNRHYYLYALEQPHLNVLQRTLPPFFEHLEASPVDDDGRRLVVLTLDPALQIDWEPWNALEEGEGRLRLALYPDPEGRPLPERIARLAEVVAGAAQVGFVSWIVIHLTADAPEGWLDSVLAGLVESGIMHLCARDPSVTPRSSLDDWRQFVCELNDLDFSLIERLYEEAQRSRRRSMLRIHGGGLIDILDGMVRDREGLRHELYYCRAIPTGYYANLRGEIWPCPKMAAGLVDDIDVDPLATFGPTQIAPDPDATAAWRGRDVLSVDGCAGCPGLFACAGGCALEAAHAGGGDLNTTASQPIEDLMKTVIRTQQRRLTRSFGPTDGDRR
ncbi:MAG: hypothetical protein ACOC7J_04535 [Armatimonadota bacterium]